MTQNHLTYTPCLIGTSADTQPSPTFPSQTSGKPPANHLQPTCKPHTLIPPYPTPSIFPRKANDYVALLQSWMVLCIKDLFSLSVCWDKSRRSSQALGHITEAEEKKGKKEQDKGQIDIGRNKEKEGKKYWERNWVIFTSTTYYFGWYIGRDSSCIKSTSFKHAVHVQRLQKGERQYLTAFTGLVPEAEKARSQLP